MTFYQFVLAVVIAFLASPFTQNSKQSTSTQKGPCAKAMTQTDLNTCFAQQYKKADAHLNAVYGKLLELMMNDLARDKRQNDADMVRFDETALLDLRKTERLWIRYRDSECDAAEQQIDGGSMAPMTGAICLMQVTNDRIKELKNTYETPDRKLE